MHVGIGLELRSVDAQLDRRSGTKRVFDLETILVREEVDAFVVDVGLVDAVVFLVVTPAPNQIATD